MPTMTKTALTVTGLMLSLCSLGEADLISNGSFENPNAFGITRYTAGTPAGFGWTVGGDGIDLVDNSIWTPIDGTQSIDLNRFSTGQISQTISTTPGTMYEIRFFMAGNPDTGSPGSPGPTIKSMDVSFGPAGNSFAFDTTGRTFSNMGFVERVFTATATASMSTLSFQSTNGGYAGIVLDNVSVSAVPEPASMTLIAFAAAGATIRRRRRDRKRARTAVLAL